MKNFNKIIMPLFDSTTAKFKLSVEANFMGKDYKTGSYTRPLVYVTSSADGSQQNDAPTLTGYLKPNIYLVLTYKPIYDSTLPSTVNQKQIPIYTSYPQLFQLRNMFEQMKDIVVNDAGFTTVEGELIVKPEYREPIVLTNIGKSGSSIALTPHVINSSYTGADGNIITTPIPGVSIQISKADMNESVLTVEEFLTVYTIIKDIDLSAMQCSMSLAFMNTESAFGDSYNSTRNNYQGNYNNQPYNNNYQSNRNNNYQQNSNSYQGNNRTNSYQRTYVPNSNQQTYNSVPQAPAYNSAPQAPAYNRAPISPAYNSAPQAPAYNGNRQEQSYAAPHKTASMDFASIKSVPVDEAKFDNRSAVDAIFDEDPTNSSDDK